MNTRQVVITGIGVVAPNGLGQRAFWDNTLSQKQSVRPITRFEASAFPGAQAGEIDGFVPTDFMPARLAHKLDPYTQYAVAAARLALEDGKVDLDSIDRSACGVYVGNCFGGWDFTDRQLRNLHTKGVREVSAFQATAWFPAAPQGQISILFGLRGNSKTIVCDRASGLVSVGLAARSIAAGQCSLVLAGGTEALVTPFAYLACVTDGVVGRPERHSPQGYHPFSDAASGLVPGEGAAFLVLEDAEQARARGAGIYAEVQGLGLTNDACHPNPLPAEERRLSTAMRGALRASRRTAESVSLLMADAMAHKVGDSQETEAILKVFGEHDPRIPITAPKTMTGHLYGAAGALDVAWAALGIRHGIAPPLARSEGRSNDQLNLVTRPTPADLESVMINARGSGGINASLIVARAA